MIEKEKKVKSNKFMSGPFMSGPLRSLGLMAISIGVIYWLDPSWETFKTAPIIEQGFYVLFSLVILFNIGQLVKYYMNLKKKKQAGLPQQANQMQQPVPGQQTTQMRQTPQANTSQQIQQPVPQMQQQMASGPPQDSQTMPLDADVNRIFQELDTVEQEEKPLDPGVAGKQMLGQIHNVINSFGSKMDTDTVNLENQFRDMTKLRDDINQNVMKMYGEYKKLERQMQIVDHMIRAKKLLGERMKQIDETKPKTPN